LVLDADNRHSLVCIRSLGRAGVRVGALDTRPHAPGFASRWCAVSGLVPDSGHEPDAFVDAVIDRVERHGARVLISTDDGSIHALRCRRSAVERHVRLALAHERALELAVAKDSTLAIAADLGIAVPRSIPVTGAAEARGAARQLGFPVVVKPAASWVAHDACASRVICTLVVNVQEAARAVEELERAGGSAIVQEWASGAREAVSLFRADGRIWAKFAQVAHRTWPPLGGASVVRESIPLPADATEAAERLVEAADLDGYSEVEFRRDSAGRALLMEINPRLSASVEIAVRAGVDFPLLLYRWAAGETLHAVHGYRTALRMRWLGGDIAWMRETLSAQGRPDVMPAARAAGSFVGDFFRAARYDYLAADDLRPAAAASAAWARAAGVGAGRRVRAHIRRTRRSS
jgi:predicted ATP-grasp superfamily ATP-dependent carboligase